MKMNKILFRLVVFICAIVTLICVLSIVNVINLPKKEYPTVIKITNSSNFETEATKEVETEKETTESITETENKHGVVPGVTKSAEERARIRAEKEEATTLNLKLDKFYKEGDYAYVEGTLKNNSSDYVTYVKYDIIVCDADNNIIQSEWSNWSGILPPGASTPVHTMFRYTEGTATGAIIIEEIKTK